MKLTIRNGVLVRADGCAAFVEMSEQFYNILTANVTAAACHIMLVGKNKIQVLGGYADRLEKDEKEKLCRVNLIALLVMVRNNSNITLYGITDNLVEDLVQQTERNPNAQLLMIHKANSTVREVIYTLYHKLIERKAIFREDNSLLDFVLRLEGILKPKFSVAKSNVCDAMLVGKNALQLLDSNGLKELSRERQMRCRKVDLIDLLEMVHDDPNLALYGVTESLVTQVVARTNALEIVHDDPNLALYGVTESLLMQVWANATINLYRKLLSRGSIHIGNYGISPSLSKIADKLKETRQDASAITGHQRSLAQTNRDQDGQDQDGLPIVLMMNDGLEEYELPPSPQQSGRRAAAPISAPAAPTSAPATPIPAAATQPYRGVGFEQRGVPQQPYLGINAVNTTPSKARRSSNTQQHPSFPELPPSLQQSGRRDVEAAEAPIPAAAAPTSAPAAPTSAPAAPTSAPAAPTSAPATPISAPATPTSAPAVQLYRAVGFEQRGDHQQTSLRVKVVRAVRLDKRKRETNASSSAAPASHSATPASRRVAPDLKIDALQEQIGEQNPDFFNEGTASMHRPDIDTDTERDVEMYGVPDAEARGKEGAAAQPPQKRRRIGGPNSPKAAPIFYPPVGPDEPVFSDDTDHAGSPDSHCSASKLTSPLTPCRRLASPERDSVPFFSLGQTALSFDLGLGLGLDFDPINPGNGPQISHDLNLDGAMSEELPSGYHSLI